MSAKKEFSTSGFSVFNQAVVEALKPDPAPETPRVRRSKNLTPEQRRELAVKASLARWSKKAATGS